MIMMATYPTENPRLNNNFKGRKNPIGLLYVWYFHLYGAIPTGSARVPHKFPRCNRQARGTGLSRRARQARRASIAMAASLVSIIITTPPPRLHKASLSNSFLRLLHPSVFLSTPILPNSRSALFPLELLKFEVLQTSSSASSCFDCCRSRFCTAHLYVFTPPDSRIPAVAKNLFTSFNVCSSSGSSSSSSPRSSVLHFSTKK